MVGGQILGVMFNGFAAPIQYQNEKKEEEKKKEKKIR